MMLRRVGSPVICLEQPLSRNHLFLESLETNATYKNICSSCSLWYPYLLGSIYVRNKSFFWNPNFFKFMGVVSYEAFVYGMAFFVTIMASNIFSSKMWFV